MRSLGECVASGFGISRCHVLADLVPLPLAHRLEIGWVGLKIGQLTLSPFAACRRAGMGTHRLAVHRAPGATTPELLTGELRGGRQFATSRG